MNPEIPQLPHTWIELIGFCVVMFAWWDSRRRQTVIIKQNDTQIRKVDVAIDNQAALSEQINGTTAVAVAAAKALGVAEGSLAGRADEQAREATRVGLASDAAQRLAETEGKS